MQEVSRSDIEPSRGTIVLGVTASDAHVVGNHLIAMYLRRQRFHVVNLGACTPTEEFMRAASQADNLVAVLIGSLNGHALEDLADLPRLREQYGVTAPIIVGGNLSVGAIKSDDTIARLHALGADGILSHPRQILDAIGSLDAPPPVGSTRATLRSTALITQEA
ncbi:cobalamin-dependent protein [Paraburkholderia caribensis]|uniref:cobalamin-dependent protein n=1 Tax=Paraburkholderia caribensis TaxID=75105 RepID=UPI0006D4448D|nr:cobalamin-dependent protein [Paraburkholderia caribensis]